jgi:hypothetical protein
MAKMQSGFPFEPEKWRIHFETAGELPLGPRVGQTRMSKSDA